MARPSLLGIACVLLVIVSAQVLSGWLLVDPTVAAAESVFAGMVATAVSMICGRFPI
jgi:hypothetical protein